MTGIYRRSSRDSVKLGAKLGEGGRGAVYEIGGAEVAKIFDSPVDTVREEKLRKLTSTAVVDASSLALPTEVLVDDHDKVVGYVMPKADGVSLSDLADPMTRIQRAPKADWRSLFRVARNVAATVHMLHGYGIVHRDLKPEQFIVGRQCGVTLLDLDDVQLPGLASSVNTPLYTEPEYYSAALSGVMSDRLFDYHALGVVLFQTLFGSLPWVGGRLNQLIPDGAWIGAPGRPAPKRAIHPSVAGEEIERLFFRTFTVSRTWRQRRPNALRWYHALKDTASRLQNCTKHRKHWYLGRSCYWCVRATKGEEFWPN